MLTTSPSFTWAHGRWLQLPPPRVYIWGMECVVPFLPHSRHDTESGGPDEAAHRHKRLSKMQRNVAEVEGVDRYPHERHEAIVLDEIQPIFFHGIRCHLPRGNSFLAEGYFLRHQGRCEETSLGFVLVFFRVTLKP